MVLPRALSRKITSKAYIIACYDSSAGESKSVADHWHGLCIIVPQRHQEWRWISPTQDAYGSSRTDLAESRAASNRIDHSHLSNIYSFRTGDSGMVAFNRVRCTVL